MNKAQRRGPLLTTVQLREMHPPPPPTIFIFGPETLHIILTCMESILSKENPRGTHKYDFADNFFPLPITFRGVYRVSGKFAGISIDTSVPRPGLLTTLNLAWLP